MGGSVVFARWRQCAPPSSMPQSASAQFRCCPLLNCFEYVNYQACPGLALFTLKIAPSWVGIWTPSNTWFLGSTRVSIPNGITISSTAFVGLTVMTDRPCCSICSNRLLLASAAMRPNSNNLELWFCLTVIP